MKSFINIDDQIREIQNIGETQGLTLYSILFRNAGVGILWFDNHKAGPPPLPPIRDEAAEQDDYQEKLKQYHFLQSQWIKKGLVVEKYYPSLSEALEGEKERIRWKYRKLTKPGDPDPSGLN